MICTLPRKPLNGGVLNALPCAAMNLDACRVGTSKSIPRSPNSKNGQGPIFGKYGASTPEQTGQNPNIGRFPANLIIRSDPVLLQWFLSEFGLTQEGVAW
jgi:site-specific DNA-methyltransferase (adenine-specific)